MTWQYTIRSRTLVFKEEAITSRGSYRERTVWYVALHNPVTDAWGIGECAPLPGLSEDDGPDFAARLDAVCRDFVETGDLRASVPTSFPAARFGLETALLHARAGSVRFFSTPFSRGEEDLPINGLVWMGDRETMARRIEEKLAAGFTCVKCKIGGIDFESELELLRGIRERFPDPKTLELRLDANGAFTPENALERLEALAEFSPHSIEQPIRQGQWDKLAEVCANSPIPVALDEELIGVHDGDCSRLLDTVRPAYLVLKPTLHGGLKGCERWIDLACTHDCGFWVTSALESNVGLNAIAQWCGTLEHDLPQGLGTGRLYVENCPMPVAMRGCGLHCDPKAPEPDVRAWVGLDG